MSDWTTAHAAVRYRIADWGDDFFRVAANGDIEVQVDGPAVSIPAVVRELRRRGVESPVVIRFNDVLRARVERINAAFDAAIEESGYNRDYRLVYPIKVNQMREVVEEILDAGKDHGTGLECGSKAELVAGLVQVDDPERLLLVNGVKDDDMLRLVLDAQALGRNVLPIMEKVGELNRLLELGAEVGVAPRFGVRVRLDTAGAGKWASSGGSHSKFGLSIPELVDLVRRLHDEDRAESLRLLHFHIGSQIADIRAVRDAVRELARIYVELVKRNIVPEFLDVGGGLGVSYGGGYGDDDTDIAYSLREYASAVVHTVKEVCDASDAPHPVLVSESGRALTAHHSVLVVDVLDGFAKDELPADAPPPELGDAPPQPLVLLRDAWAWSRELGPQSSSDRVLEAFHDARETWQQVGSLFDLGYITLEQRAIAERLYWSTLRGLADAVVGRLELPPELAGLEDRLADHYLGNFSVFQSALDHWAIGQRFPVVPLARLDEEPTRRAVLVDLTCDSDGQVSQYVVQDGGATLPVHPLREGEPYLLGMFLVGAYQDIMGDVHNLIGRVAEAHVYADDEGDDGFIIEKTIAGTSIEQMLGTVQYFPNDLLRRMEQIVREQASRGTISRRAGIDLLERYRGMFTDPTYMERARMQTTDASAPGAEP